MSEETDYYNEYHVRLLLDAGADINLTDKQGRTALSFACIIDCTELVKILISVGARPTLPTPRISTPLAWVLNHNNSDILEALIGAGLDINEVEPDGMTAITRIIKVGDGNFQTKLFIEHGGDLENKANGWNALIQAIHNGRKQIVSLLLKDN